MSDISKEYAKALYDLSDNASIKEECLYNMNSLIESMDFEIRNFLMHPEIKNDEKKKVLSSVFDDGLFKDFIFVLIDNDRLSILDEIRDDYKVLLDNEKNILDVIVYSHDKLSSDYLDKLKEKLSKKTKRNISLTNIIDEKITAGIKVTYESKEIDLTLDTKMKNFKEELKESL